MNVFNKLSDAELTIMLAVWKNGKTCFRRTDLEVELKVKHWNINTINTLLSRLVQKRFLLCRKNGNNNEYLAQIGENEYLKYENKVFLQKLYNNSVKNMFVAFCDNEALSEKEVAELENMLAEYKHKGD